MTKGRVTVRRGDVTVTVHAPIETTGVPRESIRELADTVRDIVRCHVDEPVTHM
jgi:hypothetical protein